MATKFVFEDGDNTPSSILLKNCFNSCNIFFSNGCSNLLDKACSIQNDSDIIYIFYDVSPNNSKTVKGYNDLIDTIKSQRIKSMYVVPILCIEYWICQMFVRYNYMCVSKKADLMVEKLVIDFDWQALLNQVQLNTYESSSLEHTYKSILNQSKMTCQMNHYKYSEDGKTKESIALNGIFYDRNCECDSKFCSIDCSDTLALKAERLYTILPIFHVISDQHQKLLDEFGIDAQCPTIDELKEKCQNLYNTICNSMQLNRICVLM